MGVPRLRDESCSWASFRRNFRQRIKGVIPICARTCKNTTYIWMSLLEEFLLPPVRNGAPCKNDLTLGDAAC